MPNVGLEDEAFSEEHWCFCSDNLASLTRDPGDSSVIMGQALSSHELFVEGLKRALKAQGIKVKRLTCIFFDFVKEICPWFPLKGTIALKRWE